MKAIPRRQIGQTYVSSKFRTIRPRQRVIGKVRAPWIWGLPIMKFATPAARDAVLASMHDRSVIA